MKAKDKKDLQTKNKAELGKMLKDAYIALRTLRFDKEQNTLKNTRSLYHKRKEIAVIKSIMTGKKEEKAHA